MHAGQYVMRYRPIAPPPRRIAGAKQKRRVHRGRAQKNPASTEALQRHQLNLWRRKFCLDGDCYAGTPKPSSDFNESAAALAALSKAAEGLGDPPLILTAGKVRKGYHKMLGISDCCKDGGWGTDVGLAQCERRRKSPG
ncbi:conjugal transfer protein TraN [Enterovibrio norvegicus]|uniref:conjugal transfer protein TraN n=1 Tax=Enterovibrio norvegicus TaxID=188144 RepID=UPI0039B107B8